MINIETETLSIADQFINNDKYYIIKNNKVKAKNNRDKFNVLITASLHGDEIYASEVAFSILHEMAHGEELNNNIDTIIVYPFINKSGIRARQATRSFEFSYDLNDDFYEIDPRDNIKTLINTLIENDEYLIIIDMHNSANTVPCFLIDFTDSNADILERTIINFNSNRASTDTIDIVKYHTDKITLKNYINNDNIFKNHKNLGYTFEFSDNDYWGELKITSSIIDFINFIPDDVLENSNKKSDIIAITNMVIASCSGIVEYSSIGRKNKGDEILVIHDLYSYENILSKAFAMDKGILISTIKSKYANIGECLGLYTSYHMRLTD